MSEQQRYQAVRGSVSGGQGGHSSGGGWGPGGAMLGPGCPGPWCPGLRLLRCPPEGPLTDGQVTPWPCVHPVCGGRREWHCLRHPDSTDSGHAGSHVV